MMPIQKDLKRIVRSRMEKTSESYTTARRHVVSRKASPPSAVTPPQPDYAALAGTSDAAVRSKTGRTWSEWVETLDAFGATEKPHRDVARHVSSLGIEGWWAQCVTVGYERIRGLRARGQRRSGSWEASKSKTVPVPVARLFDAFADPARRAQWLGDVPFTVRTAKAPKSMRVAWADGTSVDFWFADKGTARSAVSVQHVKLTSQEDAQARKKFWGERLDALAALLTS